MVLTVLGILLMSFILYHINPLSAIALASFMLVVYLAIYIKERKIRQAIFVGMGVTLAVAFGQGTSYAFNNVLKPHQQDRINTWLRPELCDPRGPLYNIIQSKMAIGSGGLRGKGFLDGTMTKLNYVPEQTTDFIFSTVGEEQGFLGAIGIIIIFTLMVIRMTVIGERAKSPFVRNYAYCVAGIFFIHYFINIAMTMGIMPIVGIPLPFLSKGGSSLIGFTILIGTLIKMDWDR
jgi:rod shape determining protein RodA